LVLPDGLLRSVTPQTKTCLRGPRFGGHFVAGVLFLGLGQAFELLQMVDVVAGHGFDDGPESHGAAFGVGGVPMAVVGRDGGEEEQVPVAGGLEEGQCGFEVVGSVALGPVVLVEGLDDGVGLIERGGEGLAEAEGEDDLAVGEVGGDVGDAPLAGGGRGVDLGFGEVGGEGAEMPGGGGEDGDGVLTVQVAGVRV
jgi:hypothetical protein